MKNAFKVTTNGRALLAELMATEKPLELSRVAVGSGTIDEAANLADQHELIAPVAYGTIVDRRHSGDYLYLTAQYDNSDEANRDVGMFYLAEFIVYAKHPVSGEEIDLLYATLGDYKQPVPAYSETEPPCVFKFPMVLVVSDQIEVTYSGAPGLVTRQRLSKRSPFRMRDGRGRSRERRTRRLTSTATLWTWRLRKRRKQCIRASRFTSRRWKRRKTRACARAYRPWTARCAFGRSKSQRRTWRRRLR